MKRLRILTLVLLVVVLAATPLSALAQNYSFSVPRELIAVYINEDGTVDVDYEITFANDPGADPIDFVDIGLPNTSYRISDIFAEVDGVQLSDIEDSPYVQGIAVGLGSNAIQPGQTGTLRVFIPGIEDMFYVDSTDPNYASVQFVNSWIDSAFVSGDTDLSVTFVLPPGLSAEDPRWQSAPSGFPSEPEAGFTDDGRIFYTWRNPEASGSEGYLFGASVPRSSVLDSAILEEPPSEPSGGGLGIDFGEFFPGMCCFGFIILFVVSSGFTSIAQRRRKFQYLPPKVTIGGHGIKRGLTAVEAAILLEQPMDKILTMVLFAVIKKGSAKVLSRDPLEVEVVEPIREDLRTYENDFLLAFMEKDQKERSAEMREMMVKLVKGVGKKMKGFSNKETVDYYQDIVDRAWQQVAAAETPDVKSQRYEEVMEWTMMDRDYEDRTRDVFRTGPVILPSWWHNYDPGVGRPSTPSPSPGGTPSGSSLPTLPGSEFAGSVVKGVESFAAGAVGSITDFTSGVTRTTNPPPPPSSRNFSSGGGSSSCACACAGCACACACAGGGR